MDTERVPYMNHVVVKIIGLYLFFLLQQVKINTPFDSHSKLSLSFSLRPPQFFFFLNDLHKSVEENRPAVALFSISNSLPIQFRVVTTPILHKRYIEILPKSIPHHYSITIQVYLCEKSHWISPKENFPTKKYIRI